MELNQLLAAGSLVIMLTHYSSLLAVSKISDKTSFVCPAADVATANGRYADSFLIATP